MTVCSVTFLSDIQTVFLTFFSLSNATVFHRVQILKNLGVIPIAFVEESRKISSLSGRNDIGTVDLLSFLKA